MASSRSDGNQAEIVKTLRKLGYRVRSLQNVGGGMPDLLVCRRGQLELIEVKAGKGKLRQSQIEFQAEGWPVRVVRSVEDLFEPVTEVSRSRR